MIVRLLVSVGLIVFLAPPAWGSEVANDNCGASTSLEGTHFDCTYNYDNLTITTGTDVTAEYTVFQACFSGTSGEAEPCGSPQACQRGESVGTVYGVRRNGQPVGTVCLLAGEEDDFERDIGDLVLSRFRSLAWPESGIEVQPRGGRTLVNLDTLFYTENAQASSRSVRLLNRSVTIEAVPVEYVWHFGDGSSSATASAGTEYVEGQEVLAEGRVTHRYVRVAGDVSPRVDTTYRGRYRVGDGAWQPIEVTLTVEGEPVSLEVVEARPQLVR